MFNIGPNIDLFIYLFYIFYPTIICLSSSLFVCLYIVYVQIVEDCEKRFSDEQIVQLLADLEQTLILPNINTVRARLANAQPDVEVTNDLTSLNIQEIAAVDPNNNNNNNSKEESTTTGGEINDNNNNNNTNASTTTSTNRKKKNSNPKKSRNTNNEDRNDSNENSTNTSNNNNNMTEDATQINIQIK